MNLIFEGKVDVASQCSFENPLGDMLQGVCLVHVRPAGHRKLPEYEVGLPCEDESNGS